MKAFVFIILVLLGAPVYSEEKEDPLYDLVSKGRYGYETTEGDVMLFYYLGKKDNTYMVGVAESDFETYIYKIEKPYKYVTEYAYLDGEFFKEEVFRVKPDMILNYVFVDAMKGHLKRHKANTDEGKKYIWVDKDNQIEYQSK